MCVPAEQDKGRAQRHHDELVISINAGKKDLHEKTKERGAAADANRKAGYAALLVLRLFVLLGSIILASFLSVLPGICAGRCHLSSGGSSLLLAVAHHGSSVSIPCIM